MTEWVESLALRAHENLPDQIREALWSRGVSDGQIDLYRIGWLDSSLPEGPSYGSDFIGWWENNRWQLDDVLVFPLTNTLGHMRGLQFRHVDRARKGYLDYFAAKDEAVFFGLGQAAPYMWASESVWLVEGNFDLLPLQRHRPNIVSTLHAGVPNQLWRVLRRLVSKVYIAYDNDSTGRDVAYEIVKDKREYFEFKIVKVPPAPLRSGRVATDPNELWESWGDARLGVFLNRIDPLS